MHLCGVLFCLLYKEQIQKEFFKNLCVANKRLSSVLLRLWETCSVMAIGVTLLMLRDKRVCYFLKRQKSWRHSPNHR